MYGRIATHWVTNHDLFSNVNKNIVLDGEQWASALVKIIWDLVREIWQHRNNYVHQQANKSSEHRAELQEEVQRLFQLENQTDPTDRQAFATPQERVMRYTNAGMDAWITRITPRINQAIRRAHSRTKNTTKSISTYFKAKEITRADVSPVSQPAQSHEQNSNQQERAKKSGENRKTIADYFVRKKKNDDKPP